MTVKIDQIADAIVAAPGVYVEMLNYRPSTEIYQTSATWATIDEGGSDEAKATFHAPIAGKHFVRLIVDAFAYTGDCNVDWRLVFDRGTADEQIIGDTSKDWHQRYKVADKDYNWITPSATVDLTQGDHTVEVQWSLASGTSVAVGDQSPIKVEGILLSGSGAGGALSDKAALQADFSTSSTSFVDVDNGGGDALTLNFDTVGGENVLVYVRMTATLGGGGGEWIILDLDGQELQETNQGITPTTGSSGNLSFSYVLENLTAGSHTLKVKARVTSSSMTIEGSTGDNRGVSVLGVVRYRGGLVPIQLNGEDVVGQPRALNFIGGGVYQVTEGYGANAGVANIELNQAVTAVGELIDLTDPQPTNDIAFGSGDTLFIPSSGSGSLSFEVSSQGLFKAVLTFPLWATSVTTGQFKLVFDEGTADEQIIGYEDGWTIRSNANQYQWPSFMAHVTLSAGSHTVKAYGKEIDGSGLEIVGSSVTLIGGSRIQLQQVTGSGAGGVLTSSISTNPGDTPQTISSVAPTYTVLTKSSTDSTPLRLTVDVSADEAVLVVWSGCARNVASNDNAIIALDVDGSIVHAIEENAGVATGVRNMSFSHWVTGLSAGSHTFTLKAAKLGAFDGDFTIEPVPITGYNPLYGAQFQVVRFRGGLVPIRQDGETKIDKPAALDFRGAGVYTVDNYGGTAVIELNQAITALGGLQTVEFDQSASDIDIGATDTQFLPDTTGSTSFSVDNTGTYRLELRGVMYCRSGGSTTGQIKLVFDEGTADEQTVGYDENWQLRISGDNYSFFSLLDTVQLSAGSHTVKGYAKETSGSSWAVLGTSSAITRPFTMDLQFLTGSGAGGTLVDRLSATALPQTITANFTLDNYDDITGLSTTVDVSEGEQLLITLRAQGLPTAFTSTVGRTRVLVGSTPYLVGQISAQTALDMNLGGSILTEPLAAGSYSVKAQAAINLSTMYIGASSAPWCDMEITRFRGGLVPIRQDGVTIVDKPAALDFVGAGVYEVSNSGGTARIELNQAITAPGVSEQLLLDNPSGTQTVSAASYEDIDANFTDISVNIPATGTYLLQLKIGGIYAATAGAEARFRILDSGTPITTDDETWESSVSSYRGTMLFAEPIELTAGEHTFTVQWQRASGSGTPTVATYTVFEVRATMLTGSGAGGALTDESAVLQGDYTVGTSFADIDNGSGDALEVTVDVSEGERVLLIANGTVEQTSQGNTWLQWAIDGTGDDADWQYTDSASSGWEVAFSFSRMSPALSAGSHTFTLQAKRNNASVVKQDAFISVVRLRGGLVPIRQDGETKVDKPAALDFRGAGVYTVDNYGGTAVIELNEAITALGDAIVLSDGIPSSDKIINSGSDTQVFPETGSLSFEAKVTGLYAIQFSGELIAPSSNSSAQLKLVFDEGEANEQTIGYGEDWQTRATTGNYTEPVFRDTVELTAGSHTVKAYGKLISGASVSFNNADRHALTLMLTAITGSGAGGTILASAIKTSDQAVSIDTDTKITELDLTFDVSANEQVDIYYEIITSNSGATTARVLLYRLDSGSWVGLDAESGLYSLTHAGVLTFNNLEAGSHTVEFGYRCNTSATTIRGGSNSLTHPLYSNTHAVLYRGGLVPIRQDGETKVDKPAALDFIGAGVYTVENSGGTARIELNQALTAPGYSETVTYDQGTLNTSDGTPTLVFDGYFTTTAAGRYRVQLDTRAWQTWNSVRQATFTLYIDPGTADEIVLGGSEWELRLETASVFEFANTFTDHAELSVGTHNVRVYAQNSAAGGSYLRFFDGIPQQVTLDLVSGSGAGGTLVDSALKPSSQTITSGSVQKVTGLDLAFDTADETVDIHYEINTNKNSGTIWTRCLFFRVDGGSWQFLALEATPYGCKFTGTHPLELSAGSHTVEFGFYTDSDFTVLGGDTLIFSFYPNSRAWVTRYRGGLVPVRNDSVTVIDKPVAIDFISPGFVVTNEGGTARVTLENADGYLKFSEVNNDPVPFANDGYLYVKNADGYAELFFMDDYGLSTQVTKYGRLNADEFAAHASSHIFGGTDTIDGDKLAIDWSPTNYVPTTNPSEVTSVDELTAHLAGVDGYLLNLGNGLAAHETNTANPHATNLGNIGNGTLAELNIAVTDATLFDRSELDGYASVDHDATHIYGATDEIDGDKLAIDWNPTNYIPTTSPSEVDSVDELTAHLAGIDGYVGATRNSLDGHLADTANPHATTLDLAYDGGGSGAGRTIAADAGPVFVNASGSAALELDGYLTLDEIDTPSALVDSGILYAKDVSAISELHYVDSGGSETQITNDGALATDGYSGTVQVSASIAFEIADGLIKNVIES